MRWEEAIRKSESNMAVRENKVNIYLRFADGASMVSNKKHPDTRRRARSREIEGFDDWLPYEEFFKYDE